MTHLYLSNLPEEELIKIQEQVWNPDSIYLLCLSTRRISALHLYCGFEPNVGEQWFGAMAKTYRRGSYEDRYTFYFLNKKSYQENPDPAEITQAMQVAQDLLRGYPLIKHVIIPY